MTDNPFKPKARGRYEAAMAAVKQWTRAAMELDLDEPVSVSEVTCQIPNCPPVETVIVAMPHKGHWLRTSVHKPMPDVLEEDVLWALRYAERVERPRRG
jgi:hypothetical protein